MAHFKTHLLSTIAHNQLTATNKLKLVTHCYWGSVRRFPYWRSLAFHWITLGSSIHRTFDHSGANSQYRGKGWYFQDL